MPTRIQQASAALPSVATTMFSEWELYTKTALNYIWTAYCAMSGNYIAVVTVVVVLLLSFLLPDITQKLHATQDLKSMKKVVNKMSVRSKTLLLTVTNSSMRKSLLIMVDNMKEIKLNFKVTSSNPCLTECLFFSMGNHQITSTVLFFWCPVEILMDFLRRGLMEGNAGLLPAITTAVFHLCLWPGVWDLHKHSLLLR